MPKRAQNSSKKEKNVVQSSDLRSPLLVDQPQHDENEELDSIATNQGDPPTVTYTKLSGCEPSTHTGQQHIDPKAAPRTDEKSNQYRFSDLLEQYLSDPATAHQEHSALHKKVLDEYAIGTSPQEAIVSEIALDERQLVTYVKARLVELLGQKTAGWEDDGEVEDVTDGGDGGDRGGKTCDLGAVRERIRKEVEKIECEEWGAGVDWGGEGEGEMDSCDGSDGESQDEENDDTENGDLVTGNTEDTSDGPSLGISRITAIFSHGYTALAYNWSNLRYLWMIIQPLLHILAILIRILRKLLFYFAIFFIMLYIIKLTIYGVVIVIQGISILFDFIYSLFTTAGAFIPESINSLLGSAFSNIRINSKWNSENAIQIHDGLNNIAPLFAKTLSGSLDSVIQLSEMTSGLASMSIMLGTLSSSILGSEDIINASSLKQKEELARAYRTLLNDVDRYKDHLDDIDFTLASIVQKTEVELIITMRALKGLTQPISGSITSSYPAQNYSQSLFAQLRQFVMGPSKADVALKKEEEALRASIHSKIANSFYEFIGVLDKELESAIVLIDDAKMSMKTVEKSNSEVNVLRLGAEREVGMSSLSLMNELKTHQTATTTDNNNVRETSTSSTSTSSSSQLPSRNSILYCIFTFYLPNSCSSDSTKSGSAIRYAQDDKRKNLEYDLRVLDMDARAIAHLGRFQEVSKERLSLIKQTINETRRSLREARSAVKGVRFRHTSRTDRDHRKHEMHEINALIDLIHTEIACLIPQIARLSKTKHLVVERRDTILKTWRERFQSCEHASRDQWNACIWDAVWGQESIEKMEKGEEKVKAEESEKM